MEHVRLGNAGMHVSRLALGMMSYGDRSSRDWILDDETAEPIIRRAVALRGLVSAAKFPRA